MSSTFYAEEEHSDAGMLMLNYDEEEDELALIAESSHAVPLKKGMQTRLNRIAEGLQDVMKSAQKAAKLVKKNNVFKMMEFACRC